MKTSELQDFEILLQKTKLRLLRMHYESNVGHIGGNLSAIDIMMYLFHYVIEPEDAFILSKGHAAGALYATLWSKNKLKEEDLITFHKDGSKLPGHPVAGWHPDILFSTGSLGHGLSLATGISLGKRIKRENGKVFCLMSDGEWNEGSCWEALIFAAHHKLDSLIFIVDMNGLQGFGRTKDVANLDKLSNKLNSFGAHVVEIDGHNPSEILQALCKSQNGLRAIIANTKKGHGISFMENKLEWHYLPMTEDQYKQAVEEVKKSAKNTE